MTRWNHVNGSLRQITCKGANVVGSSIGQSIYRRNYNNNTWTKLPGSAVWAAAGIDDSIWCCNECQEILRWNTAKGEWDKMPGACVQIDAWSHDRAVCVNASHQLFEYKDGDWHRLPGAGTHITIGADGEKWAVNFKQEIYRMLPDQDKWHKISGSLKSIHCTDGNHVAGVNAARQLYSWDGSNWTKLPGSGTHIGITCDDQWVVNSADVIYQGFD